MVPHYKDDLLNTFTLESRHQQFYDWIATRSTARNDRASKKERGLKNGVVIANAPMKQSSCHISGLPRRLSAPRNDEKGSKFATF